MKGYRLNRILLPEQCDGLLPTLELIRADERESSAVQLIAEAVATSVVRIHPVGHPVRNHFCLIFARANMEIPTAINVPTSKQTRDARANPSIVCAIRSAAAITENTPIKTQYFAVIIF